MSATATTRSRGPFRILVADDDPDQRLVHRALFKRAGFDDIVEAADGDAALQVALEESPDLIVLDLAMPVRSGVDVLPELHERVPGAQIVVVSNFPRRRMAAIVRERGAVGYVEKRTRADRLVEEILVAAAMAERAAHRVSSTFDAEPTAPREARHFVRDFLDDDDGQLVSTVELLVSEMVTNAVLHTTGAPTVDIQLTTDVVRVEVYDDDPTLPEARTPDEASVGGRGLVLLENMAGRWGAEPIDGGKVVWFEIDRVAAAG